MCTDVSLCKKRQKNVMIFKCLDSNRLNESVLIQDSFLIISLSTLWTTDAVSPVRFLSTGQIELSNYLLDLKAFMLNRIISVK